MKVIVKRIIKPVYRSNRQRLMVILISLFFMIRKTVLLGGVHFLTIPRGKSVDMFPEGGADKFLDLFFQDSPRLCLYSIGLI